jgi:general nucleoside transport system permease protein
MILELGAGIDVGVALEAFWRGSLGTSSALLSGTLVRAIPLAVLGVALSIAFRAGVFNIGGEGQLALGAVAATVVALNTAMLGALSPLVALLAAMVAGGVWAAIAAFLRWRFDVLEVISTIMLNFVALNLVSYLVRGPMQESTGVYPQTESLPGATVLPQLWPQTRLHAGLLIAIAVALAAGWALARTAAGFRLRAVGASPTAALTTGRVSVRRVRFTALVVSGALAGLAGGIEVTGVTYALYENLSPGYGFSAIAVALLARLNPIAVLPSALLFATLETGALGMQRDAGIPSVVALAIEATIILAVVALAGFNVRGLWPTRPIPARAS